MTQTHQTVRRFVGWRIAVLATITAAMTGPGQTIGVSVFIDPNVFDWVPRLHLGSVHLPFGIREIIMFQARNRSAYPPPLRLEERDSGRTRVDCSIRRGPAAA